MKDLTKILKVGDEVYCTLTGDYMKITDINSSHITGFPIQANYETTTFYLTKAGQFYYDYPDDEPIIYPSKENRDWYEWEAEQEALQQADVRGSLPHYFNAPDEDKGSRFCRCGKYLTDDIHLQKL